MSIDIEQRYKQILVLLCDVAIVSISLGLAYALRFSTFDLSGYWGQILLALPLIIFIRVSAFALNGLYRGMWRFVSLRDLAVMIQAVTISSLFLVFVLFLFQKLNEYPRSVFFIEWFTAIVLLGGIRFAYRIYREGWFKPVISSTKAGKQVLIVGAGRAGEMILREILGNFRLSYVPVGFVDDNRDKRNRTIHGYRVLGHTRDIPKIAKKFGVQEVYLAIPAASGMAKRRIMLTCKRAGVKFKTLPGVSELLNGTVKISELREFQIEDLLGRTPAKLDNASIKSYLRGKTVMITGAGGSIGSELCRQILRFAPDRLILFERSEFNLYQIHMNLLELFPEVKIYPVIGDVLNEQRIEKTLINFMPDVIFHAAAYKHVPLMEMNPGEALENNIRGTRNMAHLAHVYGVKKFVMVSTDKAVRPTNIMGVTKRIAELVCEGIGKNSKTKFVTVRFGNVLNSVGSVIPLFKQQIVKGGPVTVTHPEIYRYFMTIPESVQLIMQAGAMGQGGEIFILDMGEPVKIVDLARDMITLSGLEPGKDIKIVFTGIRPGEKLFEELLTDGEEITSTLHDKIKVATREEVDAKALMAKLDNMFLALEHNGYTSEIIEKIKEIVPEFQPENGGPEVSSQTLRDLPYEDSRPTQSSEHEREE